MMLTSGDRSESSALLCECEWMKRILVPVLLCSTILGSAEAAERYGNKQSVVISPDLSAPWVMQLNPRQIRKLRRLPPPVAARRQTVIGATITTRIPQERQFDEPQDVNYRNVIRIGPDGQIEPDPSEPPRKKSKGKAVSSEFMPQEVAYNGTAKPGTIVIDTKQRFLFLVGAGGTARRYGVGVGKAGFEWKGTQRIAKKAEWPVWTPPEEMKIRVKMKEGRILPDRMEGGPDNPLGARAMYLGNTLYRIHGTNQPWTIGSAVSSGCIRMRNEDVVDLYERVKVGTRVIVM